MITALFSAGDAAGVPGGRARGQLWQLALPGPDTANNVGPLVAMLRLLWPNPDHHGDPENSRPPTIEQARAVVHLAVTIVRWGRDGRSSANGHRSITDRQRLR
jgi:hypothetical protein